MKPEKIGKVKDSTDRFIEEFHYALRKGSDTYFSAVAWGTWHLDEANLYHYLTTLLSNPDFQELDLTDPKSYDKIFDKEYVPTFADNVMRHCASVMALMDKKTKEDLASWMEYA